MKSAVVLVVALLVAACGSSTSGSGNVPEALEGTTSSSGGSLTTSSAPTTAAPSTSAGTTTAAPFASTVEEDLVGFLATLEELLVGTSYEGEALNEPDVFVATGRLFCERLDKSDSADDVLSAYLDELAGGVGAASDDELVLAGALLGAAVGALCPEHAALVG
ncbi:MAG: DUF732 domain-containing protein [Actinomycetota bacterium]